MLGLRGHAIKNHSRQRLIAVAALTSVFLVCSVRTAAPNTISAISRDVDSSGRTVITIVCAEDIGEHSFRSYPIPDPPRAVVVMEGITEPVEPDALAINDRHIHQLRLGYHPDRVTPELHVILDLKSDEIQILDIRRDGVRLVVEVGALPSLIETSIPLPSHTPSPAPPVITPTPSPFLTPTPTSTPFPSATETPSFPDRPAPPVLPPPPSEPSPSPTAEPTRTLRSLATPTPNPEPVAATRIVDVAAIPRGDGSTLLRITADGRLPLGCARTIEVDDPPRIIVTIRGVSAPDLPRTINVGDSNLDRIRIVHDAETTDGELHLVLHLITSEISVAEFNQVGPHLVVQLSATNAVSITP